LTKVLPNRFVVFENQKFKFIDIKVSKFTFNLIKKLSEVKFKSQNSINPSSNPYRSHPANTPRG